MVSSVVSLVCALSLVSVSNAVSLNLPAPMDPSATIVRCPDGGQCPDRNTCCMMLNGRYGCCPLENAVCCSDKKTCCPRGTICWGDKCFSETAAADALLQAIVVDKQAPSEDKVRSEPVVQKVEEGEEKDRCPDGSYCASGYHCCSTGSAYRCCQYGWACCGGGYYCCSLGSNDNGESAAHRFVREIKTK